MRPTTTALVTLNRYFENAFIISIELAGVYYEMMLCFNLWYESHNVI